VAASPLPRKGLAAIAPPLAARERVLTDGGCAPFGVPAEELDPSRAPSSGCSS
jgi:hypothetical protein